MKKERLRISEEHVTRKEDKMMTGMKRKNEVNLASMITTRLIFEDTLANMSSQQQVTRLAGEGRAHGERERLWAPCVGTKNFADHHQHYQHDDLHHCEDPHRYSCQSRWQWRRDPARPIPLSSGLT